MNERIDNHDEQGYRFNLIWQQKSRDAYLDHRERISLRTKRSEAS